MSNKRQTQGQRIAVLEKVVNIMYETLKIHDKELGKLITDDKEIIKDLEDAATNRPTP